MISKIRRLTRQTSLSRDFENHAYVTIIVPSRWRSKNRETGQKTRRGRANFKLKNRTKHDTYLEMKDKRHKTKRMHSAEKKLENPREKNAPRPPSWRHKQPSSCFSVTWEKIARGITLHLCVFHRDTNEIYPPHPPPPLRARLPSPSVKYGRSCRNSTTDLAEILNRHDTSSGRVTLPRSRRTSVCVSPGLLELFHD